MVLNMLNKIPDPIKTEIKNRITDRIQSELTDRSRAILSKLIAGSGFKYDIS